MYDTRVYKERRKARIQTDPEYRLKEQQKLRERYLQRKKEKFQAASPQEIIVDVKPNDIIPPTPAKRHQQPTSSPPSRTPSIPQPDPESERDALHLANDVPNKTEPASGSSSSATVPLQTISIKLPQNMAVLVVPVNLTSVSDDDTMQLQQVGRRVAIVRGSLTNVAEFQVLPPMTFDASTSRVIAMETDIRQIVTSHSNNNEEGTETMGPTIQITPQAVESVMQSQIVEEDQEEVEEVEPVEVQPVEEVPVKEKPKIFSYIEAIRCGRCMRQFEDLVVLGHHQRTVHQMRCIETRNVANGGTAGNSVAKSGPLNAGDLLSMESKIAARLEKGSGRRTGSGGGAGGVTVMKRGNQESSGQSPIKGKVQRASKMGNSEPSGGVKKTPRMIPKVESPLYTCQSCSLSYVDGDAFNAHLQTHQMAAEDGNQIPDFDGVLEENEGGLGQGEVEGKPSKFNAVLQEHIFTDATGNQIVIHAQTPEQLQELLASIESGSFQVVNGVGGTRRDAAEELQGQPRNEVFVIEDEVEKLGSR